MNNSGLPTEEAKPDLSEKLGKLTTLIEAAHAILESKEWSTLKAEFETELERLKRVLFTEAKKRPMNENEIYFLQGRIESMERWDLAHMAEKYRAELETIRKLK